MDEYRRAELATLHNRDQPFRTICDDLWKCVVNKLSNHDAAALSCVCRFHTIVVRKLRTTQTELSDEDERLLRDVVPLAGVHPVRNALRIMGANLLVCVNCMPARYTSGSERSFVSFLVCGRPVCVECWRNPNQKLSINRLRMWCGACREFVAVDDENMWDSSDTTNEGNAEKFERFENIKIDVDVDVPDLRKTVDDAELAAATAVAARIQKMTKRYVGLHHHGIFNQNRSNIETIQRECRLCVLFLEKATNREVYLRCDCGASFAWTNLKI